MSAAWWKKTCIFGQGELDELQFFGREGAVLLCSKKICRCLDQLQILATHIGGIDHVVNYEMPLNAEVGFPCLGAS